SQEPVVAHDGQDAVLLHQLLDPGPVAGGVTAVVDDPDLDGMAGHPAPVVDGLGPDLNGGQAALEHLADEPGNGADGTDLDDRLRSRGGRGRNPGRGPGAVPARGGG